MSPAEFAQLRTDSDVRHVCEIVFDEAESILGQRGTSALTLGQMTVFCVKSFIGAVSCDGIDSFLENTDTAQIAEHGPAALHRVGLPQYAEILQEALARCDRFEDTLEDPDGTPYPWMAWMSRTDEPQPFADLEKRFCALYNADEMEFRVKLHNYIMSNESEFAG